eukprot:3574199-Prymnesium_polylepis.1
MREHASPTSGATHQQRRPRARPCGGGVVAWVAVGDPPVLWSRSNARCRTTLIIPCLCSCHASSSTLEEAEDPWMPKRVTPQRPHQVVQKAHEPTAVRILARAHTLVAVPEQLVRLMPNEGREPCVEAADLRAHPHIEHKRRKVRSRVLQKLQQLVRAARCQRIGTHPHVVGQPARLDHVRYGAQHVCGRRGVRLSVRAQRVEVEDVEAPEAGIIEQGDHALWPLDRLILLHHERRLAVGRAGRQLPSRHMRHRQADVAQPAAVAVGRGRVTMERLDTPVCPR